MAGSPSDHELAADAFDETFHFQHRQRGQDARCRQVARGDDSVDGSGLESDRVEDGLLLLVQVELGRTLLRPAC